MSHDGSSPAARRPWFRRALIAAAVFVAVVGSYSAAYAVIRWREVVTLDTPYMIAIGFHGHAWDGVAYRIFQPAYAVEIRVRAWRMERWWRPLAELDIANDDQVSGRGMVARYWYRRGFVEGMTNDPASFPGPPLWDPEGVHFLGFRNGERALMDHLRRRLAARDGGARIGWSPPRGGGPEPLWVEGTIADHAIITASLNELRAKLRDEGFTGLVDNR